MDQVRHLDLAPQDQWNVSHGDKLFREQLVTHGFKSGAPDSAGGWQCYITDVIKSVTRTSELTPATKRELAEAWAPVLKWELEYGQPTIVVSVGRDPDRLLSHLLRQRLIPPLPRRMMVYHYAYLASHAEGHLGPNHPERIRSWSEQFAAVRSALDGSVLPTGPSRAPSDRSEMRQEAKMPQSSRSQKAIEVPESVREDIAAGLTPHQIYVRNDERRDIYLAAITEEARVAGELASLAPTAENVQRLRDQRGLRWERIAVRVFGDPRRTRDAMNLYDEAKGHAGAAQESYTGRGRRFPKMGSS